MKSTKWNIPLLILVALSIWGWNFLHLFQKVDPGDMDESELPEIPENLVTAAEAATFPDLTYDPFDPDAILSDEPKKEKEVISNHPQAGQVPPPVVRERPPTPPNLRINLVVRQPTGIEVMVTHNDGRKETLSVGDKVGEWEIVGIDLYTINLKHPKLEDPHEIRIPNP